MMHYNLHRLFEPLLEQSQRLPLELDLQLAQQEQVDFLIQEQLNGLDSSVPLLYL